MIRKGSQRAVCMWEINIMDIVQNKSSHFHYYSIILSSSYFLLFMLQYFVWLVC